MFRRYSQKCENIFRVARSMSGTFSSSVNFAFYQFLRPDRKLSVLQDIERPCEVDETNYSFSIFERRHKRHHEIVSEFVNALRLSSDTSTNSIIEKTV